MNSAGQNPLESTCCQKLTANALTSLFFWKWDQTINFFLHLGKIEEIILEARLTKKPEKGHTSSYVKDKKFINGLSDYILNIREHIKLYESDMVELRETGANALQEIDFLNFPPSSIIAFRSV